MRQASLPLAIGQELKSVESDFDAACSRARVNTLKTQALEDGSPPVKSVGIIFLHLTASTLLSDLF